MQLTIIQGPAPFTTGLDGRSGLGRAGLALAHWQKPRITAGRIQLPSSLPFPPNLQQEHKMYGTGDFAGTLRHLKSALSKALTLVHL